jgi:predicted DNA-binding transcriptional regulator AlpA
MKKQILEIENLNSEELKKVFYNCILEAIPEIKKALQPEDEQLLSINATAKLLNKTRSTIYNYIKRGIKPFNQPIRRAGSLYFKRSIILEYREEIS